MTDFLLWKGEEYVKKTDLDKYNEHQVVNYLCKWYRAILFREVNGYYKQVTSENTISLESLKGTNDDGEFDVTPVELTCETNYDSLDQDIDFSEVMNEIKKILVFESASLNHRGVDYILVLDQLLDVNWSPTEASKKFGGSKSLWNQRAKSLITYVAKVIRDKYPSYVESFPQLVGSKRSGSHRSVLTEESLEERRRESRKPRELDFRKSTRTAQIAHEILNFLLKAEKSCYVQEIVNGTSLNKTTVGNACKFLTKKGFVDRTDGFVKVLNCRNRKTNYYSINENGKNHLKELQNV